MKLIPWANKSEERGATAAGALMRMRQDMDDLLRRVWQDPWAAGMTEFPSLGAGMPRMDMSETENEVLLRFEVPGTKPEDVEISVSGNVLTLKGEKTESRQEKGCDCTYSERTYGAFSRSVQLPATVNAEKIEAVSKDGVLTVKLGKKPEAKARKVQVRQA